MLLTFFIVGCNSSSSSSSSEPVTVVKVGAVLPLDLFATSGIYGIYLFNEHYDNTVSLYTFYTPKETGSGPVWTATAFYRDYYVARDSLEIIGD